MAAGQWGSHDLFVAENSSEVFWNASLLEGVVCPVTRFDLVVDHEAAVVDRTVPNLVIALAMTDKDTAAIG
jgi:hypothetical protein